MNVAAVASILIAAAALGWTIYRDIAQRRALSKETRERENADSREEERRVEEIALLRRQIAQSEDREHESRAARLIGFSKGSNGSSNGIEHPMFVRNIGSAPAENVAVWLAYDQEGTEPKDARPLTQQHPLPVVVSGDEPSTFPLTQVGPFPGGRTGRNGLIVAAWQDGNGEHVDKIGTLTIFQ